MKIRNLLLAVTGISATMILHSPHDAKASRMLASVQGHTSGSPISWHITGQSNNFGPYEGELRMGSIRPDGTRIVVREIQFQSFKNHEKSVAELWDGLAKPSMDKNSPGWRIEFVLKRAGFIAELPGYAVDRKNLSSLRLQNLMRADLNNESLIWDELGEKDFLSGSAQAMSEPELGKNTEMKEASHPVFGMGTLIDIVAGRFKADAFVKSFADNKEFKSGVQYALYDFTNFEFYQKKTATLRVVDQLVTPASLTEEELRYEAYAPSLAEKAARFDVEVPSRDLDQFGMISIPSFDKEGKLIGHEADYDSALWTGQYIASQFFRYQVTKDPLALQNIKKSVSALVTLVEISNDPKEFARALLPLDKAPDTSVGWIEGLGRFGNVQYNIRGNNDMIRGVVMGLLFANEVLPDSESALKGDIAKSIIQLAEHSRVVQSKATHRLTAYGAAFLITGDEKYKLAYEELVQSLANGIAEIHLPKDIGGISDWSGNNLGITQDILRAYIAHRMNSKDATIALHSSYLDWKDIQNYRVAPYVFFLKGENSSRQPITDEKVKEAIFNLHEFPGSKPIGAFSFDHSIDSDFVLSPYPSQPWKFIDKTRPISLGYQSIVAYPMFESAALTSHWAWRESPFAFQGATPANSSFSGADYLFAYWMGRYYNLIKESD